MCRIAHLTSAHPRNDTRIFIKQCRTLAAHGYDVTLVVADDQGDDYTDGVAIADVGRLPGRLNRIFKTTRRVFDKAVALDADIYQLHDPPQAETPRQEGHLRLARGCSAAAPEQAVSWSGRGTGVVGSVFPDRALRLFPVRRDYRGDAFHPRNVLER
jgi:hypothetical protein